MCESVPIQTRSSWPIQIFISYSWAKDEEEKLRSCRKDSKWKELRGVVKSVADEVVKRAENRKGDRQLDIRINRLRGCHGRFLLTTLRERIGIGDITIMDIGDTTGDNYNANVLIEVGIALGLSKIENGRLFVLKPQNLYLPSDLSGVLYTDYKMTNGGLKILDEIGFRAALRTIILDLAAERSMIGPPAKANVEAEED